MARPRTLTHPLLILIMLLGVLLSGCSIGNDDEGGTADAPAAEIEDDEAIENASGPETIAGLSGPVWPSVTIEQILTEPDEFIGEAQTIHGTVDRVIEPKAIVVENEGERMLVVGRPDVIPADLGEGIFVRATGLVRRFDLEVFGEELGTPLDPELYEEYVDEPVIFAERVAAGATPLAAVLDDLEQLTGTAVNVIGRVGEVFTPQAFVLEASEGDGDILAVVPFPAMPEDRAGRTWVRLVGTVVVLDDATREQLEQEFPFLFSDPAFEPFQGERILVGDLVEIVAPAASTTFEDIIEQPGAFVDQIETISGQVSEIVSPQAIVLTGLAEADAAGARLPVLGPARIFPEGLSPDAMVVVTGRVQVFDIQNPPDLFGEPLAVDYDPALFADFDDEPVIVAQAITVIPE